MRSISFGELALNRESLKVSLPLVMLALLLCNAGLGTRIDQLQHLLRHPLLLLAGYAGNLLIPLGFIWGVSYSMQVWHNADEVQNILVGLAMVAAMPIAGSSTAWAQNANGNIALSLGLVLFSTFLSPLTTPLSFDLADHMASGEYAQALENLEHSETGLVLILAVLAPSLLGLALRGVIGTPRVELAKPALKVVNSLNLLLLNYSNASVSLPSFVADPDWDFLAIIVVIVALMCLLGFLSGWAIARLLRADRGQQIALMFGLGMNNNGTGLVLASLTLAHYPRVMLPIIFYNLIQHLIAGIVDSAFCQLPDEASDSSQRHQPEV